MVGGMSLDIYLYEDWCHHCERGDRVYWANITHNLTLMAEAAGIYGVLWRPGENGIKTASQLIEPLRKGISAMKADPDRYETYNSPNGWGTYANFLPWLEELLKACEENPNTRVRVSV